jgi:hypothetical protein
MHIQLGSVMDLNLFFSNSDPSNFLDLDSDLGLVAAGVYRYGY